MTRLLPLLPCQLAPSITPQTDAPAAASAEAIALSALCGPFKTGRSERVFASPLARRIAADAGLELARLPEQARMAVSLGQMEEALLQGRLDLLFSQSRCRRQLLPQLLE